MFDNIVFIGGIHGVGKSTICLNICQKLNLEYLSASELLKWNDINDDIKNKKVEDIPYTQNRLITGLKNIVNHEKFYLLDGHYCLLNKDNEVENISINTFLMINPIAFCLILGDVLEIKNRLEVRDSKPYKYELLELLQDSELNYSKLLSKTLNTPLHVGNNNDYSNLTNALSKIKGIG